MTPPDRTFVSRKNDTSVLLFRDNARVHLTDVEVQKFGYSSSPSDSLQSGANSAVNIVSPAVASLPHRVG